MGIPGVKSSYLLLVCCLQLSQLALLSAANLPAPPQVYLDTTYVPATEDPHPALSTQAAAHQYRFMGLEIAVTAAVPLNYVTLRLDDNTPSIDQLPTDIILDRDYIHGSVLCHCKRGVMLNSRRTTVIDSYASEFHTINQDVQALGGQQRPRTA